MSTDVIGARYRLASVVTCTPESTTWDARDTWLDEPVLVVTPEPGCDKRFAALTAAVLDRSSAHLVGLYDIGSTADQFIVFRRPAATLSDERGPREEEDVLVAGRALGDALEALHVRGIIHGDLHPGSVVAAESGVAALSPWPLAPRPHNWSGPGGFGSDPDEPRKVSARDDVRALGAVLLAALAGPPVLSSEQVGNIERELAGRAPNAVVIADRALTPQANGGYAVAAELRDDCAAVLAGQPVATAVPRPPTAPAATTAAGAEPPEGRRAALVLVASGAALFAGLGVAGSTGAGTRAPVHPVTAHAAGCVADADPAHCAGPAARATTTTAAPPVTGARAQFADNSVAVAPARTSGAPATVSTSAAPARAPSARPPGSTTTAPPSTTTSSSPTTTTTASPPTTTTAPTTTTTAPSPTTTSTSSNVVQAGPTQGTGSWSGSGGGSGQFGGTDR